jgi:bifunctional non-homologous end joining protein LigD
VWRGRVDGGPSAEGRWVRPPGSEPAESVPAPEPAIPRQVARGADTGDRAAPAAAPARGPADAAAGERGPAPAAAPDDAAAAVEAATGSAALLAPAAVEARRLEQHFVYNALNTIASLMRTDPVRARELLLGFADLTRAADRPEGVPGTLGDELAAVRAYLQLEQARFGRRLQVEIVVDEGLHALPMAPRRVLDAVRAVVQQRIEPRPDGGTVTVTAERAGAGCLVRVGERDGEGRGGEPTLVAPA